jgi:hypothetical protein
MIGIVFRGGRKLGPRRLEEEAAWIEKYRERQEKLDGRKKRE